MKTRVSFLLSPETVRRLDEACAEPGARKSDLVETALTHFLAERAHGGDGALLRRLDQTSRQLQRLGRDSEIALETLALFVRYYLTITPPLPAADQEAARALGRARFEVFIAQVGRHLGGGGNLSRQVRQAQTQHATATGDLYAGDIVKPPAPHDDWPGGGQTVASGSSPWPT
jgi:hypothetical protein